MLATLSIKNYALIEELKVDFDKGFNIVTGETGAGKSIILGALSLILGKRADLSSLRDTSKKCIVEGIFHIKEYGLSPIFEASDLDYEDTSIFRREITPSGKSRAFINDTPVNLKVMQEMASRLIDIHSQHQNLELGNQLFQLQLVDIVANTDKELTAYKDLYFKYKEVLLDLSALKQKAEKEKSDLDYFEFQYKQLSEANLVEDEQGNLENDQKLLAHAEEIKLALNNLQQVLDGDSQSLLTDLKSAINQINKIKDYLKEATALSERLESTYIELKDISEEASYLSGTSEYDPQKLEHVNERLDMIYSLQQKHHSPTIKELLKLQMNLEKQINDISNSDQDIEKLEKESLEVGQKLKLASDTLSNKRKKSFKLINSKVTELLGQLGMPHARFNVICDIRNDFGEFGTDSIQFLFSANKSGEMDEISKVASGGETSRLMLSLKSLITDKKALPSIVFDEIDAGISGEIALKMGRILKNFSKVTQLINITHLPQIAGQGDAHHYVFKEERQTGTYTSMRRLSDEERINEIASLLGGDNPSESAINAAKELVTNS